MAGLPPGAPMMRFPQQPLMQPPVAMPPLAMVTPRPPLMPMPPPVMMPPTSKLEQHVPLPRDMPCLRLLFFSFSAGDTSNAHASEG